MTPDKIRAVITLYRREFTRLEIPKVRCEPAHQVGDVTAILAHCHALMDEMEQFVAEGRLEKAFRWLGFVQGCLWSCRVYTVDQLKRHNMP